MTEVLIGKDQNENMYREADDLDAPPSFPEKLHKDYQRWGGEMVVSGCQTAGGKQQAVRTPLFLFLTKDFEKKPPSNDPNAL